MNVTATANDSPSAKTPIRLILPLSLAFGATRAPIPLTKTANLSDPDLNDTIAESLCATQEVVHLYKPRNLFLQGTRCLAAHAMAKGCDH